MWDFIGLFLLLSGFVIGLGAVTVIDLHGLLARTSTYWTEATTRTHKITKPLIWAGIVFVVFGGVVHFRDEALTGIPLILMCAAGALVINGLFLSFRVSPFLLERERQGRAAELLPRSWQRAIALSFVLSVLGWWGSLVLVVLSLVR